MTDAIKEKVIEKIAGMEAVLHDYHAKTAEILTTDIDETLERIVGERAALIETLDTLHRELEEIVGEECTPEERSSIEGAMKNRHASLGLSEQLKEIRRAAVKMRSVYLEAAEKDNQASVRVDARVKELRTELEDLSGSKKTLDYFSRNKLESQKGGSFDSSL